MILGVLELSISFCTRPEKSKGAGTAPSTGLASHGLVTVLTPPQATCTKNAGAKQGFQTKITPIPNLLYCYNSREFVEGIKVCPNL